MTQITGQEPKHWHRHNDDGVQHALKDPRLYRGYPRRLWTKEERDFVAHLEAHEKHDKSLVVLDTDHPLVRECLNHIATEEQRLATLRTLALDLRQQLASGIPVDEAPASKDLETLMHSILGCTACG